MSARIYAITVILLASLASYVSAEEMPAEVKAALKKLVGNWSMETIVDGEMTKGKIDVHWAASGSELIFHWSGTDFGTGQENSGTGMLGWDARRKQVVEHELDTDGASFFSTHQIAGDSWISPSEGTVFIDGIATHTTSRRVFKFYPGDEWTVVSTDCMVGGKPAGDVVSTFRRSKAKK